MIKFFVLNRFMWLIYTWILVCGIMFFNNPYVNMILLIFGLALILLIFGYVQDKCKLNKEEEKFLSLSQKIFE